MAKSGCVVVNALLLALLVSTAAMFSAVVGQTCEIPDSILTECGSLATGNVTAKAKCCNDVARQGACFCAVVKQLQGHGIDLELLCPTGSGCPDN